MHATIKDTAHAEQASLEIHMELHVSEFLNLRLMRVAREMQIAQARKLVLMVIARIPVQNLNPVLRMPTVKSTTLSQEER
jgi:hypothetical protein